MSDKQKALLQERVNGALLVTLNRPEALNAISPQMIEEFEQLLDRVEEDPDVASLILTGKGRAFCAGADLKIAHDVPQEDRERAGNALITRATKMMARVESLPKPVIAAVNGIATAGGMELLLCCDLVIAAESARLGDGHANFGLLPGAGASARLPRRLGLSRAKYLLFTGDLLPAENFVAAGLVNAVVPDAELRGAALELAAKIATKSPLGLRRMKELVNESMGLTLEQALRLELAVNASYVHSYDRAEGLAAFNEKRRPKFRGE